MEYQYSTLVDPSDIETDGLCDGIPVREHSYADLEEIGAFRAQQDWAELVRPLGDFKGGLGPHHSFMAVSLPECLPERFEIVSYANEFAFMHDDITDTVNQKEGDAANDAMLEAFIEGAQRGTIDYSNSGKRQMQAKILSAMMLLDQERAIESMKAWANFVELASGREHHTKFATLEEYLPYRSMDVGHMFWHALVTFGCAITIPEHEEELCKKLVQPAVLAASLTNDIFSYEKEFMAAKKQGQPDVVNALWVLMHQHDIGLDGAKELCRSRIKEEVAKYVQIVKDTKNRKDISSDTKRYIEMMQYSISGNVVWSLQCPRYHKEQQFNERQILRQKFGVDRYPTQCVPSNPLSSRKRPYERVDSAVDFTNDLESMKRHKTASEKETEAPINGARNVFAEELPPLGEEIILDPYRYLNSLPSKGVREKAIDALNSWLQVPTNSLDTIKNIVKMLHGSSLMLDDIEDGSNLRRGKPATHTVYGQAQTVNSATFQYIEAVSLVRTLQTPICLDIFTDELRQLFVGQSYDLMWTSNTICPSTKEYLQMVDGKTGGLFRLLVKLMQAESRSEVNADLSHLCVLFGRFFQIRDDYQNLKSADYARQKGFCEDLDEGKFSLPLIHALNHSANRLQLRNLVQQRRVAGQCTSEQKQLILEAMQDAGSLEYAKGVLEFLYSKLEAEISQLELLYSRANHELRLIVELLRL